MLAGATDYHLGGFRALPRSNLNSVCQSVCNEYSLSYAGYVYCFRKPLTSLCDTPEAYEGQPGFEVLCNVPRDMG